MFDNIQSMKNFYRRFRAFLGRPLLVRQKSVITIDNINYCDNPIFIMGCHRSGTSLLRRIINSHNQISCPPETNFLPHYFNILKDEASITGLSSILGPDNVRESILRQAFSHHEAFRISENKKRWADKTPQYVLEYDDILKYTPNNTQYIVIFRNPFDIAYSIYSRGWILEELDEDLLVNTCLYVTKVVNKLKEISDSENVHVIYYEELVEDTERVCKALCRFLNEDWDSTMLKPWSVQHNFGTEDPIARSINKFQRSSDNWLALKKQQQQILFNYLYEVSKSIGYDIKQQ